MAGNRPKKVEQPKTFDQATALFHRASQLKRESEQKQTSTGSAYGDTKRANYQREAPIRQERWGNRVVKPETQNAKAGQAKSKANATARAQATRAEYVPEGQAAKRTMPSGKGTTAGGGTRGSVTQGRMTGGSKGNGRTANGGTSGTIQNGKASSSKARIERVFASESEAAKRGASGQPLRTKEEKGKYVSGADYKAWKTAQDQARLAAKKKGK